jgi:hypothetical protein
MRIGEQVNHFYSKKHYEILICTEHEAPKIVDPSNIICANQKLHSNYFKSVLVMP